MLLPRASTAVLAVDAAAAERASRLNPASLVGQWVRVQGLGVGRVAAFHRVANQLQRLRGADSYHTIELTARASTAAASTSARLASTSSPDCRPTVVASHAHCMSSVY